MNAQNKDLHKKIKDLVFDKLLSHKELLPLQQDKTSLISYKSFSLYSFTESLDLMSFTLLKESVTSLNLEGINVIHANFSLPGINVTFSPDHCKIDEKKDVNVFFSLDKRHVEVVAKLDKCKDITPLMLDLDNVSTKLSKNPFPKMIATTKKIVTGSFIATIAGIALFPDKARYIYNLLSPRKI